MPIAINYKTSYFFHAKFTVKMALYSCGYLSEWKITGKPMHAEYILPAMVCLACDVTFG